jgi:hypothetical protein
MKNRLLNADACIAAKCSGVIWLLSLTRFLYSIDMWFNEDQRVNTIKAHLLKEIGLPLQNLVNIPTLNSEQNWDDFINKQALFKKVTQYGKRAGL